MNDFNDILDALGDLNFSTFDDNVSHVEVCHQHLQPEGFALCPLYSLHLPLHHRPRRQRAGGVGERAIWTETLWNSPVYPQPCIADLCVVATLPVSISSLLQLGHWPFGNAMCKITHLIFSVNPLQQYLFPYVYECGPLPVRETFWRWSQSEEEKDQAANLCWRLAAGILCCPPETTFSRRRNPTIQTASYVNQCTRWTVLRSGQLESKWASSCSALPSPSLSLLCSRPPGQYHPTHSWPGTPYQPSPPSSPTLWSS